MKNNVRITRMNSSMTQEQLARKVGVTRQTIGLIEKGEYNPSLHLSVAIAKELNKTLDELFWEVEMSGPIEIYVWHSREDDSYKISYIKVNIKDLSEKKRIEKLMEELKIVDLPIESPPGIDLIKRVAKMLKVDFGNIDLYINHCLYNDYDDEIKALGFSEEDIEEIWAHFLCRISMNDWKSMLLFENDEEMFKYVYIEDNDDKESLIEIILEMGKVSKEVLIEDESVMNHMIEVGTDEKSTLKLSSGKWVVFTDELLYKEDLMAID